MIQYAWPHPSAAAKERTELLATDAHAEAERVHIRLLREAGLQRRVQLACDLTRTAIRLSRAAIQRRHPEWSEREVGLRFVELCYGAEAARGLRERMARGDA